MADSSAEYIQHHLTNLTYGRNPDGSWGFAESGEQAAEMGFYAIHVDSMFWSIFLGLVFCTVFRSVAKSATSGVPGMLQCCIEAIVDFIDDLTISIFQHKNPLIAPLALTIFVWVFLMNLMGMQAMLAYPSLAAVLVTVLVVFGIGKISDFIFKNDENVVAYKVEVQEKVASGQVAVTDSIDIKALLALGTVEHGQSTFKKCKACHSIKKGGKNNIGPALYNVVGRKIGVVNDYKYSKALAGYGKEWTFEELNGYLIKPAKWIKGTKMAFAGLRKEKDRASVIKYLNENSDSPLTLP